MKIKSITLAALFIMCFSQIAFAQDSKPIRFLVNGALEFGGDPVATVFFTNGDSQKVRAGQGISVGLGFEYAIPKMEQIRLRSTVGIKYVTTAADDVHIRLTRIPFQFTGNYVINDAWRIGAGLAVHSNIKFNSGGLGGDFNLKTASGPIFEVAYKYVGLSYTAMKYSDQLGNDYSANAIGITFSGVFPGRN